VKKINSNTLQTRLVALLRKLLTQYWHSIFIITIIIYLPKMQVHVHKNSCKVANTAAVARHTRLITALTVALTSSLHHLK